MPPSGVYLENDLLKSTALEAIKSANTLRVLLEFLRRRKIFKPKKTAQRREALIMNNGEIVFTYRDAMKRLNISQATFSRCLSELVELGFLDIAELSSGLHRQPTKWTISDRWKAYGTPDFVKIERTIIKPPFARKKKRPVITGE